MRASGGDKITHLLDYQAKLCLKRLVDPMGELRWEGKKTTKHSGPPVTERLPLALGRAGRVC